MTLKYHMLFDLDHACRALMGPAVALVMVTYPQERKQARLLSGLESLLNSWSLFYGSAFQYFNKFC